MTAARIVTVDIDELNPAGDGIATAGRHRVAVPFTIPGERVRIQLVAPYRARTTARLIEVVRPSPHRVVPACRHFGPSAAVGTGACGGCSWQHIAYPEQLRLKTALVDRLVRAVVRDAPPARLMLPGTPIDDPWGYRNKVHFVFGHQGARASRGPAPVTMGHYMRGSRRVIPIVECPVHDPRGNAFAFAARDVYAAALNGGGPASLRSLAVRAGHKTDELMATIVVSDDRDRRVRAATRRILETMPPTSMHLNIHAPDDAFIFGPHTRRLRGPARMREQVGPATFLVSPTAFFQTNVRAAEILVRLVLDALPTPSRVLDLYAGCGLFAIPLALAGHQVIAVEENREAVADGEAALALNSGARQRCQFVGRRVEDALRSFRHPDAVVLDPPRDGCSASVLTALVTRVRPSTIVYVSCNPEALAQELRVICRNSYQIRALQPVDMFPHSAHVETLAVLSRVGRV